MVTKRILKTHWNESHFSFLPDSFGWIIQICLGSS